MASVSVGDIYLVHVGYQEDAKNSKLRPIVILSVSHDCVVAVAAPFTSVAPKMPPKYHDGYKFAVAHWSYANLNKPSWIKTHPGNLLKLNTTDFTTPGGSLHSDDLVGLLNFIAEQD